MAVPGETLVEIFVNRAATSPDQVALQAKQDGVWKPTTFREFADQARRIAGGLIALGVEQGDRVALLSENRPEWLLSDAATMLSGAISVPIYSTSSADQVAYILSHSEAKVAFVENQEQLDKIVKGKDGLPALEKVIIFDGSEGASSDDWVTSLSRHIAGAQESDLAAVDARTAAVAPEDIASIVYTSGTTGAPKGAMLSHRGFVYALRTSGSLLSLKEGSERVLSYLPLSHIFERLNSGWGGICFGMQVWFAESLAKLRENLLECKPTFFIGVPRVYEKFHAGMKAQIEKHKKRHLIEKSLRVAREVMELEEAGRPVPLGSKLRHRALDKIVLSKLRAGIGMQEVRLAVTAGAPIDAEVMKFIRAIGIDLIEGYGQTETNAPTTLTPPGKVRIGAVGPPIPGLELRFDTDGEILVKGPNLFSGYYKDEESTREALTDDGFLRTGDVGSLDEAGYLRITDRKKDLIKTAAGKYIAPQGIEGKLKLDPLIAQAVVIGDRRPFPTALLTLDAEAAAKWAEEKGIQFESPEQIAGHPALSAAIESRVAAVNSALSHAEQIKKWTLLARDFSEEAEEITPSLKVRRKIVLDKYSDVVEKMYAA